MDFQQIRDFVNPAVAQATGLQEVDNLAMPVPVAFVANGNGGSSNNLMLVEMEYSEIAGSNRAMYTAVDSATDIINAFLAGKTVLFHLDPNEEENAIVNIGVPLYLQMLGATPEYTDKGGETYGPSILVTNRFLSRSAPDPLAKAVIADIVDDKFIIGFEDK